jgi:hypothetical protein
MIRVKKPIREIDNVSRKKEGDSSNCKGKILLESEELLRQIIYIYKYIYIHIYIYIYIYVCLYIYIKTEEKIMNAWWGRWLKIFKGDLKRKMNKVGEAWLEMEHRSVSVRY